MSERIEDSNKYIPASWTKQAMDRERRNPQESDRELLARLWEETGSITALGERIHATRKPVMKLLISESIIEQGQPAPRLTLRPSSATRAKMSASAISRWAEEKRKREQGLPSFLDKVQSEEAQQLRLASLKTFWESEEGARKRQEMSEKQRKAKPEEPAKPVIPKIKHPRNRHNAAIVEQASRLGLLSSLDPKAREILQRYLSENSIPVSDLSISWGITPQAVYLRERTALRRLAKELGMQDD